MFTVTFQIFSCSAISSNVKLKHIVAVMYTYIAGYFYVQQCSEMNYALILHISENLHKTTFT